MKKITKMNNKDAMEFFLKSKSYSNIDLPEYIDFQAILDDIYKRLKGKKITDFYKNKKKKPASSCENVNYKLLNNKNGKYAWRPLEFIHPVLYIALVQEICEEENWKVIMERFCDFSKNKKIKCCSIPIESASKKYDTRATILNWWNMFEQKSIALALDYQYMGITDISDCYSSIYTHTIPWAIHTQKVAKSDKKNMKMIGNIIDSIIQEMSYGQTNGIPQGSVLMDFIAEMILGYADELLSLELEKEKIEEYYILRYRDDYRIFCNNTFQLEIILKKLSEILSNLNLKLNTQKTFITDDVITYSIKKDKMKRIENSISTDLNFQKQILIIRQYGIEYPNCGSISVLLKDFYNQIKTINKRPHNMEQIISIVIDIMLKNPRTYSIGMAILSKLFQFTPEKKKYQIIDKIVTRFSTIPNTDYLNIWLQRITILDKKEKEYSTLLCKKMYMDNEIWNSEWLNFKLDESLIINKDKLSKISNIISEEVVDKFFVDYNIG